ncbi:hypothetical protein Q8F55_005214 [Vanrija albida]|uniref:Uncharacterized protein n=1 Tax=Vanrija albida TaxID=181172 RepID=A0ABR3Q1A6_9TREE
MGVTVRNVDSHFTNWRRRSNWNNIKQNWAHGTKSGMANLIKRYESGEETREEVRDLIQKMKAYFLDEKLAQAFLFGGHKHRDAVNDVDS